MALISEEEKLRRRQSVESVLGTNAMEGLFLDASTLSLMKRFEEGEIEIEQLSLAIDLHVRDISLPAQSAGIAGERTIVDAA